MVAKAENQCLHDVSGAIFSIASSLYVAILKQTRQHSQYVTNHADNALLFFDKKQFFKKYTYTKYRNNKQIEQNSRGVLQLCLAWLILVCARSLSPV